MSIDIAAYTQVKVYLVESGVAWILGSACPQKFFNYYQPTFEAVITNFRLPK